MLLYFSLGGWGRVHESLWPLRRLCVCLELIQQHGRGQGLPGVRHYYILRNLNFRNGAFINFWSLSLETLPDSALILHHSSSIIVISSLPSSFDLLPPALLSGHTVVVPTFLDASPGRWGVTSSSWWMSYEGPGLVKRPGLIPLLKSSQPVVFGDACHEFWILGEKSHISTAINCMSPFENTCKSPTV